MANWRVFFFKCFEWYINLLFTSTACTNKKMFCVVKIRGMTNHGNSKIRKKSMVIENKQSLWEIGKNRCILKTKIYLRKI